MCVTSVGISVRSIVTRFRSGIDRFCVGLVIGMSSRVSNVEMSPSAA